MVEQAAAGDAVYPIGVEVAVGVGCALRDSAVGAVIAGPMAGGFVLINHTRPYMTLILP